MHINFYPPPIDPRVAAAFATRVTDDDLEDLNRRFQNAYRHEPPVLWISGVSRLDHRYTRESLLADLPTQVHHRPSGTTNGPSYADPARAFPGYFQDFVYSRYDAAVAAVAEGRTTRGS